MELDKPFDALLGVSAGFEEDDAGEALLTTTLGVIVVAGAALTNRDEATLDCFSGVVLRSLLSLAIEGGGSIRVVDCLPGATTLLLLTPGMGVDAAGFDVETAGFGVMVFGG